MAGPGKLDRVLSPLEVLLLTLSALSPAMSVFVGGNAVLHIAGTGAALGFIAGGVLASLVALLFAELASNFPGAGGTYPSINAVLGPRWAYPYVMLRLFFNFPVLAFSAVGLGAYVHTLIPAVPKEPVALVGMALAGLVAAFNIKRGSRVIAMFLGIEAVALLALSSVAALHLDHSLLDILSDPRRLEAGQMIATGPVPIALAVVTGASICAGADWATFFAEDMEGARKRIGRVIALAGLVAALTIAVPVVLVVLAIDDLPQVLAAEAPMAAFLERSAGPWISRLVSLGVIAAIFNAMIAVAMGTSRQLLAVGRDGIFPAWINSVLTILHPRLRSPIGAIAVLVAVVAAFTLLGERILTLFISGNFADYVLLGVALIVGRKAARLGDHFRVPAHPLVPAISMATGFGVVAADWSDADTARPSMAVLLGIFAAAYVWHEARVRSGRPPVTLTGSDIED